MWKNHWISIFPETPIYNIYGIVFFTLVRFEPRSSFSMLLTF